VSALGGRRVALLETRKAADIALLVRRFGGVPVCVPTVREVPSDDAVVRPAIDDVIARAFDLVIVLTAAACDALFAVAERQGSAGQLAIGLQATPIACRGPKPLLALRRKGLTAAVSTPRPHTNEELIEALAGVDLEGKRVLVLNYGERSERCSAGLAARRAVITDVALYEWALPLDTGPLERLIADAIGRRIDAMLVTSQIQYRHLLQVAQRLGHEGALIDALRDHVTVGSVGPVCSRAIRAAGVVPDVMPALPNGASLVQALADYLSMFDVDEASGRSDDEWP
jgi:uroporphyrinogen-III synthase